MIIKKNYKEKKIKSIVKHQKLMQFMVPNKLFRIAEFA